MRSWFRRIRPYDWTAGSRLTRPAEVSVPQAEIVKGALSSELLSEVNPSYLSHRQGR